MMNPADNKRERIIRCASSLIVNFINSLDISCVKLLKDLLSGRLQADSCEESCHFSRFDIIFVLRKTSDIRYLIYLVQFVFL